MWDFTVEVAHSFFVGTGGVLVHNCGPTDDEIVDAAKQPDRNFGIAPL